MNPRLDALAAGLAAFAIGTATGAVMISIVGPEPEVITRTHVTTMPAPPPRTVVRTVEADRASRSNPSRKPLRLSLASGSQVKLDLRNAQLWDRIAACESSGRWNLNTGAFDGGLQFLPSTWRSWGGADFAPFAWQATRAEQITVANRSGKTNPWLKPWPICGKRAAAQLGMRFP